MKRESGATMVEYTLLILLMIVVCVASLRQIGINLDAEFVRFAELIESGGTGAGD